MNFLDLVMLIKAKAYNKHKSKSIDHPPAGHPIHNEPAFMIESTPNNNKNTLIIADLHLGIEYSLAKAGARLPSQTANIIKHIKKLCSTNNITQLVLLGDIKHTVPVTSRQEWHELPDVFWILNEIVEEIHVIPGNHDSNLRKLIPEDVQNVRIHPSNGAVIHGIGLFHGHTWPSESVLSTEQIIMAHNHPNVLFVDKLGSRTNYSCWVRGQIVPEQLTTHYPNFKAKQNEIIIIPAFNDIGSGTPVNAVKSEFLGPMLKNQCVDLDSAHVYLLDGTDLGQLNKLVDLSSLDK
jgi:putative SbcD/Mre11-related phosphoesterase